MQKNNALPFGNALNDALYIKSVNRADVKKGNIIDIFYIHAELVAKAFDFIKAFV